MDPATFQSLKQQITKEKFKDGRVGVLRSFAPKCYFNGPQVSEILKLYTFNSEQLEALDIMAPKMTALSGEDGKNIVLCFVHANDRLDAVKSIANYINDPTGKYTVLDAITFHFDKEKARQVLDQAVPVVSHGHCPPAPCHQYPSGGPLPPGQYPPQYPSGQQTQHPTYPPTAWQGQPAPGQYPQYPPPASQYPQYPPGGQYHPPPAGQCPPGGQYSQYPPGGQYPQPMGQYPQYPPAPGGQYPPAPGYPY